MTENAPKKNGLTVIVGRSNVGKSTLLNALVGSKVAIVTPKPQTTRHVIHGVRNDDRGQIVFADTPGIFKQVPDRLTAKLNEKARDSLEGIDAVLYVVDPTRHVGEEDKLIRAMVLKSGKPTILVINKSDGRGEFRDEFLSWKDDFPTVFEISARDGKGLGPLISAIYDILPEGQEPLYPPDQLSNMGNRFWLAEIIREKAFMEVSGEIPYGINVEVESVEERPDGLIYIKAMLITSTRRHKTMLIGSGARKIKAIGQAARKEIEAVTGKRIYLDLEVAVDERWTERFE
jgi:GTP-binding protein Era